MINIKNKTFKCQIYDIATFMEMPLEKVRKLWRLMFDEAWNNTESIEMFRTWLPNVYTETGVFSQFCEHNLAAAAIHAENMRKAATAYGSVVTEALIKAEKYAKRDVRAAKNLLETAKRAHERVIKLRTAFDQLSKKNTKYESEEKS